MKVVHGDYELDDDPERLDLPRMFGWLSRTYWGGDLTPGRLAHSVAGSSLALGAYRSGEQVGCLRVVSDRVTFAWVCDVYVAEAHRGRGLGRALVGHALRHPDHQGLRRWMLRTQDAHPVYRALGFDAPPEPDLLMQLLPHPAEE